MGGLNKKTFNDQFSKRGESIHEEAKALGGVEKLDLNPNDFPISDDTVMHMATALAFNNWDPSKVSINLAPILLGIETFI